MIETINYADAKLVEGTLFGVPVSFTEARVDRDTVPANLHVYEVRKGSVNRETLERRTYEVRNWCYVDFGGTFISEKPLPLINDPCRGNAYRTFSPITDWVPKEPELKAKKGGRIKIL